MTDEMLAKLLNDPKLLKELERLVKANPVTTLPKQKKDPKPAYVNQVFMLCSLCGTEKITYYRMDYCSDNKIYQTGCHSTDNFWPDLPIKIMTQKTRSCKSCPTQLAKFSQEDLIKKLLKISKEIEYV